MEKTKVLFVCIHNSARSQMAEAILNRFYGDRFVAESAGLEAGILNPLAVESLKELGIDIAGKETKDVFEFFKSGRRFDFVVTVCDEANAERCPIFPGALKTIHWSFSDPSAFTGTEEEKLALVREVRDKIRARICEWAEGM